MKAAHLTLHSISVTVSTISLTVSALMLNNLGLMLNNLGLQETAFAGVQLALAIPVFFCYALWRDTFGSPRIGDPAAYGLVTGGFASAVLLAWLCLDPQDLLGPMTRALDVLV